MKRIALAAVVLLVAAAVGSAYRTHPDEFKQYLDVAANAGGQVWDKIEANPIPVYLALGTFLLTVVYHKAKGKSLRESVEVAATRVTVVPVPPPRLPEETENLVVKRAKARAMRTQLLTDQVGLQTRQRKLPEAVMKAEKDACYTEQAVADAERALMAKRKAHQEAVARLKAVRKDKAECDAELAEIDAELKKLADCV
jgi:chromosome segregation ATPase